MKKVKVLKCLKNLKDFHFFHNLKWFIYFFITTKAKAYLARSKKQDPTCAK